MSEVEKLRALLAEARIITQDSLDSNTTGFDEEFKVCNCNACERYRSIIQRIDAALAEPIVPETARLMAMLEKVPPCVSGKAGYTNFCECDSCREIFRIFDMIDTARRTETVEVLIALEKAKRERDEARAEVERAYQRGAEAMREEAVVVAMKLAPNALYGDRMVQAIHDLPVPEDK